MPTPLMTSVNATVDPEQESELLAGFRDLTAGPMPDGLVRTELLRGQNGRWRVLTGIAATLMSVPASSLRS